MNDKIGERWELGCDKKGFSASERRSLGAKPDRVLIAESGKSLIPRLGNFLITALAYRVDKLQGRKKSLNTHRCIALAARRGSRR